MHERIKHIMELARHGTKVEITIPTEWLYEDRLYDEKKKKEAFDYLENDSHISLDFAEDGEDTKIIIEMLQ